MLNEELNRWDLGRWDGERKREKDSENKTLKENKHIVQCICISSFIYVRHEMVKIVYNCMMSMFRTRRQKQRFKRMVGFPAVISEREFLRIFTSFFVFFCFLMKSEKERPGLVSWSLVKQFHNFHAAPVNEQLATWHPPRWHNERFEATNLQIVASDDH